MRITKGKVIAAVHKGLKAWEKPTREGMELFATLNVARKHGLDHNLSIVESRIAINRMLLTYIGQLERLQPLLAQVLIRRYKYGDSIKSVSFSMNVSVDQINRLQRMGIKYLGELIYDDEMRMGKNKGKR